jgi:hypothetical protein
MVMPRAFLLVLRQFDQNLCQLAKFAANTVVMAAVSVVLPWSTTGAHVDGFAWKFLFFPIFTLQRANRVEAFLPMLLVRPASEQAAHRRHFKLFCVMMASDTLRGLPVVFEFHRAG